MALVALTRLIQPSGAMPVYGMDILVQGQHQRHLSNVQKYPKRDVNPGLVFCQSLQVQDEL